MKGKEKKLKTKDNKSSSKNIRGASSNVLNGQNKSQTTVKSKIKMAKKNGSGKKIGDSEMAPTIKITTPRKQLEKNSTRSVNVQGTKSPKVDGPKKLQNSKIEKSKNAPSSQEDTKGIRRARKDILIVIESLIKKGEGKSTPVKTQSKTKERMQSLSKIKEEDEFLKTVRGVSSPKSKGNASVIKPKTVSIIGGRKEAPKAEIKEEEKPSRKNSANKSESKSAVKRERSRDRSDIKLSKKSAANIRPANKKPSKEEATKEKQKSPKKAFDTNNIKKSAQKKPSLPIRTPTKKFKKSKTPTPENELEEEKVKTEEKPNLKKKSPKKKPSKKSANNINLASVKIKEQPEDEEKSESSGKASSSSVSIKKKASAVDTSKIIKKPIRHQLAYKVDTQGISEEIAKILRNIDEKKKREDSRSKKEPAATKKKAVVKKVTAKDNNFKLKRNPIGNVEHIVKFSDLSAKENMNHSDVLLAILELAKNSEYYNFTYSTGSRFFWEDVIQYDELKPIFRNYKGDTLKKYWNLLSATGDIDVNAIADLVKRYKEFLDSMNIKLLSIISCIKGYLTGNIKDFEQSVKNIQVEVRKTEKVEKEEIDEETGEIKKIKIKTETRILKNKYVDKEREVKKFVGNNFNGNVEEVFGNEPTKENSDYLKFVKKLENEEMKKFEYLKEFSKEEKKKILQLNEDDKFLFKIINNIVDELYKTFPQYNKNYIVEVLRGLSMNVDRTFQFLSNPNKHSTMLFNEADDNMIINMKGTTELNALKKEKGADRVQEREDYLLG